MVVFLGQLGNTYLFNPYFNTISINFGGLLLRQSKRGGGG